MNHLNIHLHLIIHGMSGTPAHLFEAVRQFEHRLTSQQSGIQVELFVPASNSNACTFDGIDWCAERVVDEIRLMDDNGKHVTQLSVTGYSLGGLIARYVIGILYHRGFFNNVTAMNFCTFTAPHIGVPRYPTFFSSIFFLIGSRMLGRTGMQLHCIDNWSITGKPLLEIMADERLLFYNALSLFPRINIYANAINDVTVSYVSGAFEVFDPYAVHPHNHIIPEFLPGYEPVLMSYSICMSAHPASPSAWLKSLKPLPFNGPFIEWSFPLNLVLYMLLPILIPLALVIFPLVCISTIRSSCSRVVHLQRADGMNTRLVGVFSTLDKISMQVIQTAEQPTLVITNSDPDSSYPSSTQLKETSKQPILTGIQYSMIHSLNKLSNVQKYAVFRPSVRNSHAMIICLDPRYKDHHPGKGVLKHWVDNFVL